MDEVDWQVCSNPQALFSRLESLSPDPRKLRLLCVAAVREAEADLLNDASAWAVEAAERFADGELDAEKLRSCWEAADRASPENRARSRDALETATRYANRAAVAASAPGDGVESLYRAMHCVECVLRSTSHLRSAFEYQAGTTRLENVVILCDLIRCLFPFQPLTFEPSWRTDTTVAIGVGMYASREFSAMPILADALEEAGCSEQEVLRHCRGPGPHARGCACVDALLGRG